MRWEEFLEDGENLTWQGRPAPRCYTFRNWRHSIFGVVLLLLTTFWQSVGVKMADEYQLAWLGWLPIPFLMVALFLAFGHLLLARLEWNRVFYAVTDRRLLVQRGLFGGRLQSMALDTVTYFRLRKQGEELGTLKVYGETSEHQLILNCIEYPHKVTDLLEAAMGDRAFPTPPLDEV